MKTVFSLRAAERLAEIVEYIVQEDPSGAANVLRQIDRTIMLLEDQPLIGRQSAIAGFRELVVPRYPYIILYRLVVETVEIADIFHTARRRQ